MRTATKIVWLGYASIFLSIVWGVLGLACGVYALRLRRSVDPSTVDARTRRDLTGGTLLARVGIVMSSIVIVVVIYSWISTLILL